MSEQVCDHEKKCIMDNSGCNKDGICQLCPWYQIPASDGLYKNQCVNSNTIFWGLLVSLIGFVIFITSIILLIIFLTPKRKK
jgi:hypothetical protein